MMKMVTNDDNETPRWSSQNNHLNLDIMTDDIKRLGPVRFIRKGNNCGEKFIHVLKHKFASQREDNYGKILMHKTLIKK